jgi:hypothetical protein
MADRQPATPTHRAYSVIRREGQDDYWLNIGLVFQHKDDGGFNLILQALPGAPLPRRGLSLKWLNAEAAAHAPEIVGSDHGGLLFTSLMMKL